jgi:hypothetical protein
MQCPAIKNMPLPPNLPITISSSFSQLSHYISASQSYLSLAMVQNIIVLLSCSVDNGFVAHDNGINAFDLDVRQASKHLYGVDHVHDLLKALAERVKLAKDVVLTVAQMRK